MQLSYVRAQWVAQSLLLYLFSAVLSAQSPAYVDVGAMGTNDGTSWENAFISLQSALDNTGPTNIWVAAGTYKPSAYPAGCTGCVTNRDFTFQLKDGVSLYGGFAGTETLLSERDIVANPTILSGDIEMVGDASDNVHHVVLAAFATTTPTTRLDGFTISGGNANVSPSSITVNGQSILRSFGGGVYTFVGTNTLTNNSLSGNTAGSRGGGIYTIGGTNTLTNNSLSGNSAGDVGGGAFIQAGTNTLTNNSLSGNTADYGGGIYTFDGTITLTNNSLSGNSAGSRGGGIYTDGDTYTLTNNIIWGNSSGIFNDGSTLNVTYSIVQGGFTGEGNLDVDPLFVNQPAVGLGTSGDLRLQAYSPAINVGNNADVPMGVTTDLDGNDRIINGTVDMGVYEFQGVVLNLLTTYYVDVDVTSGNNTGLSWVDAFTDLQSALVQGGFSGESNLNVDPQFIDQPPVGLSTSGDLRLMVTSPAIDAGTNSGAPATDLEGKPRPIGAGYDMGAFEFEALLLVEFLVFKGEYIEKANELEWKTLSEFNNDYFVVQHSMDGVNFEAIGTENGRGANNTLTDYRFSHQNPSRGVHYYRLKQLDFDARFDYSDVISINVQGEEELALYPNPAQDQLTIVNGQGIAFIFNVLGQSTQQFSIAENQQTIQIDDLQDGHYFLRILRANGEIVVKKFVKR
jgi:predicted outer membrane repeat protein